MAENRNSINKILVALDDSPSSLTALENAVRLASRLGAELTGWYVEDINLLRLAQLPSPSELNFYASTFRQLESGDIECQLKAQAGRIRRILTNLCEKWNVPCDFKVTRGNVAAELLESSEQADLMVIGKIGRSFPSTRRTGSITRTIISRRPGMTMIFQQDTLLTYPVILLYDGSEPSKRAVDAAAHLKTMHDGNLLVMVLGKNSKEAEKLASEIADHPMIQGTNPQFRLIPRSPLPVIARRIRMEESQGPVVIPCDPENLEEEQLCALVDEISNPVMLIR